LKNNYNKNNEIIKLSVYSFGEDGIKPVQARPLIVDILRGISWFIYIYIFIVFEEKKSISKNN
jgi:hypothetical protein